jgi:hypothetical protein
MAAAAMLELPHSPADVALAIKLFFALVIGHALADYPLQGTYLASNKSRHFRNADGSAQMHGLWIHCLAAHSLIHAGCVWAVTGCAILGFIEFVLHMVLDTLKCEGVTNIHVDQVAHLACKAVYVVAIMLWH